MKKRLLKAPLPYQAFFMPTAGLVSFGFLDSIYLLVSHYRSYTDMGYRSFCALSRSINCDTVSQSPYSILFGIPIPLWGVFAYAFLILLLIPASRTNVRPDRLWTIILLVVLAYSLMSLFFAYLSTFHIRSYCIMCIATYAVNLLVLFYAWLIRRRFDADPFFTAFKKDIAYLNRYKRKAAYLFTPLLASTILIGIFLPAYWKIPPPAATIQIPSGYTADGHPWIGSIQPILTITEFTDYQCFQCKKMHYFLRTLIQENPSKIRLIHRHFPMDHRFNPVVKESFHLGAGEMALLAIYAANRNNFWVVNDLLFEIGAQKRAFNTKEIAEKSGLDFLELARARKDSIIRFLLQKDILEGIKIGVRGTPAFLIDGQLYTGHIPPEIIKQAIK